MRNFITEIIERLLAVMLIVFGMVVFFSWGALSLLFGIASTIVGAFIVLVVLLYELVTDKRGK